MYDAILIGAGYGGVTCAALLALAGKKVLVVDKNPAAGGKAMTVHRGGFGYELWPIAGGPSEGSRFHELAAAIGLDPDDVLIQPDFAGEYRFVHENGSVSVAPFTARPSVNPEVSAALPAALGASEADMGPLLDMVAAIVETDPAADPSLDDLDLVTWTRKFGLAPPLEAYLFVSLGIAFAAPLDRVPMSEAIYTFKEMVEGGGGRYGRGGYGRLAEQAVETVVAHGGAYLSNTRVEEVLVEGGRAVGVRTGSGETFRGRAVVSNAGIQPTVLKLADTSVFPFDYVEAVKALEPSLSFVGMRYWLDDTVFEAPMVIQFAADSWWDTDAYRRAEAGSWPEHPLLFFSVPSLYDPGLAPEGRQLVMAGTLCSADPHSPMNQVAVDLVDREMLRSFPEMEGHIERRQAYTALHAANVSRDSVLAGQGGECIGLAQVIGQCGATKPDVRSPVAGLYFVGCDAGGHGCGTHQAVDSGFNVAAIVSADLTAG
ncbi:MAG: NAD(P)/FAD-dependent oxidoreductase [Acidimicrobiia bacterium]|nr:NAD(P)/FAD-dependent oxidoreductase [Acidimicrobiia bacterium]